MSGRNAESKRRFRITRLEERIAPAPITGFRCGDSRPSQASHNTHNGKDSHGHDSKGSRGHDSKGSHSHDSKGSRNSGQSHNSKGSQDGGRY